MANTKNQTPNSKMIQAAMPSAADFEVAFVAKLRPGKSCPGYGRELPPGCLCPPGCPVLEECLAAMGQVKQ
jgi:hypothetical protein